MAPGVAPPDTNCALWSTVSYEMISCNEHLPADKDEADRGSQTAEYEWNLYAHQLRLRSSTTHCISNRRIHLGKIITASKEKLKKTHKKYIFLMGLCCSCFNLQKSASSHIIALMITFGFYSYWQRNEIHSKCVNNSALLSLRTSATVVPTWKPI